ncbi:MAG: hypothetical protein COA32_02030 [Fluviicola sp.]|nr:MAG: hypothetical protein COA32_02030 [Fluviicola sp.]
MKPSLLSLIAIFLTSAFSWSATDKYRLMFNDDPSSIITVGWEQVSGSNPVVYYGTLDEGTNWANYPLNEAAYRTTSYMGMTNKFAKLTNLQPNTAYYFVIKDDEGVSNRYWFRTCPDVNTETLSFISGGDSRSGQTQRQNSNRMVAKIRPHAVLFGGDLVNTPGNSSVQTWFEDWELSYTSDGQIIPFVHSFGNHEEYGTGGPEFINELFDTEYDVYYRVTFGGDLFSVYTLNGELLPGHTISNASKRANQAAWLANELPNDNAIWKSAQYHRPIVPHYSGKGEGADEFDDWANLFYDYDVRLVMESDAHVTKLTEEVRPAMTIASGNSSSWFTSTGLDPDKGITFIGEGAWGTIRTPDDSHPMTTAMASMYQFSWILLDACKIEIRTVDTQSPGTVPEHAPGDYTSISSSLEDQLWKPTNLPSGVRRIQKCYPPDADFTANQTSIFEGQTVSFTDLSTENPTSWFWDFGDGNTSTLQSPNNTYATAGLYEVTLTATNSDGNDIEVKTDYIEVSEPVAPIADFTVSNTNPSAGATVQFTDLTLNNPSSWSWNFGDGNTSSLQNPTYAYASPGTFTVSLTASNAYGSDEEIKIDYINVLNGGTTSVVIATGDDDVEEFRSGNAGEMYLTSSDLEIGNDGGTEQYTGVRFIDVDVPQGATISNAKLVFRADETDFASSQLNIYIQAEDADNSAPYQTTNFDLSSRNFSATLYTWAEGSIPGWNAGTVYETPDISALVQEVVNRGGWNSGNAMSFVLYSDMGQSSERVADSYEGGYPAELVFDWTVPAVAPPVADFTPSGTQACAGTTVDFTDNSTNNPTSWSWDFGDGATSTDQNPSHTYSTAGTYTVTLTTYNNGGSDQVVETNLITIDDEVNLTLSNDVSICDGESTMVSATGATSYTWDNGLGLGSSHTVSPNSETTYSVVAANGTCEEIGSITISVDQPLSAGTTANVTICENDNSFDLQDALSNEDNGGTWTDNDGTNALSGNLLDATQLTAGSTYDFSYEVPANGSCPDDQSTMTVSVVGQVSAGSLTANNSACIEDATFDLFNSIENYSGGGDWLDDDNTNALTNNTVDLSMLSSGSYNFTYSIDGGTCGTDEITVSIEINQSSELTVSGDSQICIGESILIEASGANDYVWDNGLGSGSQHTVNPTQSTQYSVTGTSNGCSAVETIEITVLELPEVVLMPFEVDTICTLDNPVTLPNGTPQGGVYSGNGVDGNTFNPQSSGEGEHTVFYTYTSMDGCINDSSQSIFVSSCLSVVEENMDIFNIYPNPATDKITIERENPSDYKEIKIYDVNGKIIYTTKSLKNPVQLDVSNWAKGAYSIVFTSKSKEISKKIIIQ